MKAVFKKSMIKEYCILLGKIPTFLSYKSAWAKLNPFVDPFIVYLYLFKSV